MFCQSAASCRDTSGIRRRRESTRSLFHSEKLERPVAELRQFQDGWSGQFLELFVSIRGHLEKIHQVTEALARVGVGGLRLPRFLDAIAQHSQGRLDLPLFSLARDDPEHREDVLERLKVIATIADDVDDADDSP